MSVRQMGQPRPWRSTSFAHGSQNRWWPHGTDRTAIVRRHLSAMPWRTLAFNMSTVPPYLNCLDLCSVAFAFENNVTLSIPLTSRVFQSRLLQSCVFSVPCMAADSIVRLCGRGLRPRLNAGFCLWCTASLQSSTLTCVAICADITF